MNQQKFFQLPWMAVFLLVFGVHLMAIVLQMDKMVFLTKPLLLLNLMIVYIQNVPKFSKLFLSGLIFSWLGDIFLLFGKKPIFFMLGLAAFLIAHIFYIIYFIKIIRRVNYKRINILIVVIAAVYGYFLLNFIWGGIGDLKIPVVVYAITICTMLVAAFHASQAQPKVKWWFILGAILFVLSDSFLAINKFYIAFPYSPFAIMLTYGLAQMCLVVGAIQENNSKNRLAD